MANSVLFGGLAPAQCYSYHPAKLDDAGVPIPFRATSVEWAPNGWWGEALWRTLTLVMETNLGVTVRLTAILDGTPLDGTNGQPDTRVTVTIPPPTSAPTVRQIVRTDLGLWYPLLVLGVQLGVVGLRGHFVSFQIDTVGPFLMAPGEPSPDLRFDASELDVEALLNTSQVSNA